MKFEQDYSGINSLRGFSFQIKAFVSYLLDLKDGMQFVFETIENVNLKKIKSDNIDENSENFKSNLLNAETNQAIRVKRWYGNTFLYKNYSFDALNSLELG